MNLGKLTRDLVAGGVLLASATAYAANDEMTPLEQYDAVLTETRELLVGTEYEGLLQTTPASYCEAENIDGPSKFSENAVNHPLGSLSEQVHELFKTTVSDEAYTTQRLVTNRLYSLEKKFSNQEIIDLQNYCD